MLQAPTIHAVITSRMARCLHSMRAALGKMQADLDPLITGTTQPISLQFVSRSMQTESFQSDSPVVREATLQQVSTQFCGYMRGRRAGEKVLESASAETAAEAPSPVLPAAGPSRQERERVNSIIRSVLKDYGTPASLVPALPTPSNSEHPQPSGPV